MPPPANYPQVRGVIKKIDAASNSITLKHERIPNLDMPGMTMPFTIEPKLLDGLQIGDRVKFVVADIDGDLTVLWIEKSNEVGNAISCKGVAPTTPVTKIEVEVRSDKFSTIRYEFAEGSYKGTAYVQSIGHMKKAQINTTEYTTYNAGNSKLTFIEKGGKISDARFSHYSSGMENTPVTCSLW